jgi:hypothetical protein
MLAYFLGFLTSFIIFSAILSFVMGSITSGLMVSMPITLLGLLIRRWVG